MVYKIKTAFEFFACGFILACISDVVAIQSTKEMHHSKRNCKPITMRHQHETTPTKLTAVLRCAMRVFLFPFTKVNIAGANAVRRTMQEFQRLFKVEL